VSHRLSMGMLIKSAAASPPRPRSGGWRTVDAPCSTVTTARRERWTGLLTPATNLFILNEDMGDQLLTDFELMLILAILRIGEEAYGVEIARMIEQTCGRRVVLAAAYAALDRLERNRSVASRLGSPTPERGGRAKRFFSVTPRGLRAARATQSAFEALWSNLPQLKERRT